MIHSKFQCQWCGSTVLIVIDESAGLDQEWIEDCEFCCRPNLLEVDLDADASEVTIHSRRENE